MIALDNRRREIPEVAEAVRRGSQRRPPEGGRYKINCEESAWPASWHAGAHPFDPVRRDLRMNCPVGRFTSGAPSENRTRRESPIADWRAHADFARAPLGSIPTVCCLSLVPAFREISLGLGFSSSQVNFFEFFSSLEPVEGEPLVQSRTVPYLARALR